MIHGILQFTPRITVCCVLHRCESRDIRCRESFEFNEHGRQLIPALLADQHRPGMVSRSAINTSSLAQNSAE
ncbi:hypothetical protein AXF42_Ash021377 [Apostasia shenzhenica]|uniref:Uncharacterized protein n=1 Tax=Apostasia shenzhenica TaxID=1088818 RepID=A0A2H9ZR44_9ASPA|nr:hypothetical protein AXF42_Ash021377 [Apostasia shenzhenica]